MNERECETCIRRKTIYCPNSKQCFAIENKPYYQNRIMLLEENQKYKEVINKAIKYIEENKQHEYRNGNLNEYYLELNEKEMTKLLDILKEVEHE